LPASTHLISPNSTVVSPTSRPALRALRGLLCLAVLTACGPPATSEAELGPRDVTLPGTAAVKIEPWDHRQWIVLVETLQEQLQVTMPRRKLVWLSADLKTIKEYAPPQGRVLIDFSVHPSGEATIVEIEPAPGTDLFLKPIKAQLTRFLTNGSTVTFPVDSGIPDTGGTPPVLFSLDRARIASSGEDDLVVVRWSDNSVRAHRLEFRGGAFHPSWTTVVEPPAQLFAIGIIGGGFDNFHQGDREAFVYLDVDGTGAAYVVVPSTAEVLPAHDAFFNENLTAGADENHFDYGVSIITRLSADGRRTYSVLSGLGTNRRLLNIRATPETLSLTGRVRVGDNPADWDAWLQAFEASTGRALAETFIDVQAGDMFWDLALLEDGSVLGVGSTNYTQNPSGLSVSDARDNLAVIVGTDGAVRKRLTLPAGPLGRGNEVTSVRLIEGRWAVFAGLNDAPGTHAEVFSDAFVSLRALE
jgi:hypothetical protein